MTKQRTSPRPPTALSAPLSWAGVLDRLRDSRAHRAADRAVEADLASFTTQAEVDDLLSAFDDVDSPEADRVRTILLRNVASRPRPFTA